MPSNLATTISLPYAQLIGSPIAAMIEAESLAAQASADFIESVGFIKDKNTKTGALGKLKTVTFTYEKQDVNGNSILNEISMPLLSLIPIPLLQIKDGTLEFNLKLTDITKSEVSNEKKQISPKTSFNGLPLVSLKGVYAGMNKTEDETNTNVDLKVKINVTQSDIPAGLQKLFSLMENAINDQEIDTKKG